MKKLLLTLATVFVSSLVMGQTTTENYIHTTTYQTETPDGNVTDDDKIESVTYFDGLGRPMQSISKQAGGQKQDIITPIVYDDHGRQTKDYLPYATTSNNGLYRTDALTATNSFYNTTKYENTTNPFSEKGLEASPLSRVLKQAAPGADWALGSGNEIEFQYQTNTSADNNVWVYNVTLSIANNTYTPTLAGGTTNYDTGELYKTVTKDENHDGTSSKAHTTEEFKDKQGRIILKRTYGTSIVNGASQTNTAHDTYYVYDDYGNLTYVLPPKMDASDTDLSTITSLLNDLGYQYKYDNRNRLVEKRIPGKDPEYIVYNNLDQPILTQDAIQKTNGEWLFTKYDAFGRVTYTGKATSLNTTTREAVQTEVNAITGNLWVTQSTSSTNYGGVDVFYNNDAYPNNSTSPSPLVTLSEILTINYYDTYVNLPTSAPSSVVLMESSPSETNATNVKGLATVSKVKVLDATATNVWINTLTYYDTKSRPIYIYSENTYLGTVNVIETKLDFVGKPLKSKTTHTRNGITIATIDNFTYDHTGRLLTQTQCIGDQTMGYTCPGSSATVVDLPLTGNITSDQVASRSITLTNGTIFPDNRLWISPEIQEVIVDNTYDELGQLENKGVGGNILNANRLQTLDYTYNIRGWLKGINNTGGSNSTITLGTEDLFGFQINYNNPNTGTSLFNGNISQTLWKTANTDSSLKLYSYQYDALNRITSAVNSNSDYNLSLVDYDKNGNIQHLNRKGHRDANITTFGDMDLLSYYYNGNQLHSVTDASVSTGFKDGNTSDATFNNGNDDYSYDINGNMISDENKGITAITYNYLNLPKAVTINNTEHNGTISYIYDAVGTKLSKTASGSTTYYAGNYIYQDSSLKFFNHPEGYLEPKNESDLSQGFNYIYQYKDHLGNIRLSYMDSDGDGDITASTEILEENNYYPFGLKHKGYNYVVNGTDYKYGFGGKEEQDELGLDWHDFHARNYDAALGRWMNIDPLAELDYSMTAYNYTLNNPILFSDPTGLSTHVEIVDGVITVVEGGNANDDDNIYITALDEDGVRHNTGISIGESATSHSFFDDKENAVVGAIIDLNSTDGQDFIDDEIIGDKPFIADYMINGTGGGDYDFKDRGIEDARKKGKTDIQHRYRGSKTSDGKIGSARDFGNIAAGIVAGRFGLSWRAARLGFDGLESYQKTKETIKWYDSPLGRFQKGELIITTEATTTKKAQRLGYEIGIKLNKQDGKIKF